MLFNFTSKGQTETKSKDFYCLIGQKGGINLPYFKYSKFSEIVTIDDDDYLFSGFDSYAQNLNARGLFGLTTEFLLPNKFTIGTELLYLERGAYIEDYGIDYKFRVNYLDFRLPITYSIFEYSCDKIRPYISIVPNIGFAINGKIIYYEDGKQYPHVEVGSANLASINFGIASFLGISVPIKISDYYCIFFTAEAGYNYGLSNTYSRQELNSIANAINTDEYNLSRQKRQHRGIEMSVGLKIPIPAFKTFGEPPKPPDTPIVFAVTVTSGDNGTISPIGTLYYDKGELINFIITPDKGYIVDKFEVDGYARSLDNYEYYHFVRENSKINVTFIPDIPTLDSCYSLNEIKQYLDMNLSYINGKNLCLYFNFDDSVLTLTPEDKVTLQEVCKIIIDNYKKIKEIHISGHTCNEGDRDYNIDLSEKRANAVKDALVNQGISEEKMEIFYYGPDRPIKQNDAPDGKALNRRVAIKLILY